MAPVIWLSEVCTGDPSNAGGNVHGSMPSGLLAGDSAAAYVKGGCKN